MRRPIPTVLAVALAVTALAACAKDSTSTSDTSVELAPTAVIFKAPDGPVTVGQNTEFEITYDANPTTGYEWSVVIDGTNVELVGDGPRYEHGRSNAEGSGGTDIFTFRSTTAGSSTLTFTYAFQDEQRDDDRTETVVVTVE
jgi:predicted secreted protein